MGAKSGRGGDAPSQRQLRVGEQMRHLIAEFLMRGEVHDRRLEGVSVTVSEVRLSRDLKQATVFVSELGETVIRPPTLEALTHAGAWMGGRLAREMRLKYAPRLQFVSDDSFAQAAHLEDLLDDALGPERRRG